MAVPYLLYVDAPLRQMRTSYEGLGLNGLANTIHELEKSHALSPTSSRILDSGDYAGNAESLLAQIPSGMLTSILSNTLPADVATGRILLERWSIISLHPQHKDTLEPGIYANYLAPRDGSPLSLFEFQHFLDGLESAVFGRLMNDQARTNISNEVNKHYAATYARGHRLLEEIRGPNLTAALNTFLQVNNARLQDAQSQSATHITIHGDCGWATNIHDRCKQHRTLTSSPALFRLANCVRLSYSLSSTSRCTTSAYSGYSKLSKLASESPLEATSLHHTAPTAASISHKLVSLLQRPKSLPVTVG